MVEICWFLKFTDLFIQFFHKIFENFQLPQGANSTHPYLISNPAASYSYLNPTMGGYPTILQSYDASNSSAISVTMAANQQLPPALPSAPITNGSVQTAIDHQNCTKEVFTNQSGCFITFLKEISCYHHI